MKRSPSPEDESDDSSKGQKRLKTDIDEWPASKNTIEVAREFIRTAARSNKRVVICPDKDVRSTIMPDNARRLIE